MPKILDKPNLPKEVFNQEVKPQQLSQAVRVYLANQRQGTQNAMTRAEVSRTRKKLYKQKGTGGARHGDRKAPIFVGGGIAFAPKPRDHSLKMPIKMKRQAIFGALSLKAQEKNVFVVSGLGDLTGKSKEAYELLGTLATDAKKNFQKILIITDGTHDNVYRASRNLEGVTVIPAPLINVYQILKTDKILVMEEAIAKLQKTTSVTPVTKVTKVTTVTKVTSQKKIIKKEIKSKMTTKKIAKAKAK